MFLDGNNVFAVWPSVLVQDGWTALMKAAKMGYGEVAKALLDSGADKEARNNVRMGLIGPLLHMPLGAIC